MTPRVRAAERLRSISGPILAWSEILPGSGVLVAAPNYNHGSGEGRIMKVEVGGFFGLLILIADIWALVNVLGSRSTGSKVLWTVLIILLPLVGFIIWLVAGPRAPRTA
jgi:Phospholipase_D-nuclease N-terminal